MTNPERAASSTPHQLMSIATGGSLRRGAMLARRGRCAGLYEVHPSAAAHGRDLVERHEARGIGTELGDPGEVLDRGVAAEAVEGADDVGLVVVRRDSATRSAQLGSRVAERQPRDEPVEPSDLGERLRGDAAGAAGSARSGSCARRPARAASSPMRRVGLGLHRCRAPVATMRVGARRRRGDERTGTPRVPSSAVVASRGFGRVRSADELGPRRRTRHSRARMRPVTPDGAAR